MAKFFLSGRYRPNIWPFWVQIALEFGLTVSLLALVGIASPNLYRTKLWRDGADNGFNSSPLAGLYAAANYRPYTTPKVWSQFITNYNLVIVVLSMFIMLTKSTMYMLHVFPPIISVFVHTLLIILYSVSLAYQTSSDMSDPTRPQKGAPWYITKSCSVAKYHSNIGYCRQAKSTFYCTVMILALFVSYWVIAAWSCFPSKQHRAEYEEKQRIKKEKWAMLDSPDENPNTTHGQAQSTNGSRLGALNPMTPRTLAFNTLGGTKDLPLHIDTSGSTSNKKKTPAFINMSGNKGKQAATEVQEEEIQDTEYGNGKQPMYFPPPPTTSTKK